MLNERERVAFVLSLCGYVDSVLFVMLNQWHGRIVRFSLGFIMCATVLRFFGLDGPLVTNSLFLSYTHV